MFRTESGASESFFRTHLVNGESDRGMGVCV